MKFGPLVDAAWLHEHLADPDVRVIDFRWYLQRRVGRDDYLHGHIPGAVFVALEDVTGEEGAGRHPLPTAEQFERAFVDIENGLAAIEFFKTRNVELIMRSVRSLLYRAKPDARELSLIRAMHIEVLRYLERTGRRT